TANGQTFSRDYTGTGITLPPQVEIAFRSFNPVGSTLGTDIDNIVITDPVPEPSAIGLTALGMAGLAARRRR
ncbi:MAG: PEP-CTERM sorting domain-containing protein, partial [Verrucomicrobiaceae bacterium]